MVDRPLTPAQTDDKDWTWVITKPCPECGLDVASMSLPEVVAANRRCADDWSDLLTSGSDLAERPSPTTWSVLEYGCHVRDVLLLFSERLSLMLTLDNPTFANWDPNTTQEAERYDLQDPAVVAQELRQAGHALADRFEALSAEDLQRTGNRSDGASFTIESFARYELHDPYHHLWDVRS